MSKGKDVNMRVHKDLKKLIDEVAEKNKLSKVRASREIVQVHKLMKGRKELRRKIIKEIKF
jgi:uncharacterized ubiquitin-like protein YukD